MGGQRKFNKPSSFRINLSTTHGVD